MELDLEGRLDACRSTEAVCLLVFLAAAALVDLRTRRIPNVLTISAMQWQTARNGRRWRLPDARRQHFPYGLAIAFGTGLSLLGS